MPKFTLDQLCRWKGWRGANAVSARRSNRLARYLRLELPGVVVTALTLALSR